MVGANRARKSKVPGEGGLRLLQPNGKRWAARRVGTVGCVDVTALIGSCVRAEKKLSSLPVLLLLGLVHRSRRTSTQGREVASLALARFLEGHSGQTVCLDPEKRRCTSCCPRCQDTCSTYSEEPELWCSSGQPLPPSVPLHPPPHCLEDQTFLDVRCLCPFLITLTGHHHHRHRHPCRPRLQLPSAAARHDNTTTHSVHCRLPLT